MFFCEYVSFFCIFVRQKRNKKQIMKTITNLNSEKVEIVFSMTGFNYDIRTSSNEDGTENIEFDSKLDAEKFENLYNEL